MLRRTDQPHKERRRDRHWWVLLWLLPPITLLAWTLIGVEVQVGDWQVSTHWREPGPEFYEFLKGPLATRWECLDLSYDLITTEGWAGGIRLGDAIFEFSCVKRRPRFDSLVRSQR